MPRNFTEKVLNRFGSALIDIGCAHDVHIVNGRLQGVTDVIGSTQLFNYCTDYYIESEDFSDHFIEHFLIIPTSVSGVTTVLFVINMKYRNTQLPFIFYIICLGILTFHKTIRK